MSWKSDPKWKKPVRPGHDRMMFEVLHAIRDLTATEAARGTFVSAATVRNWKSRKTRWPQHATMAAIAGAVGLEFRLVQKGSETAAKVRTVRPKGRRSNGHVNHVV